MEKEELVRQIIEISAKTALSVIPIGGTLITEIWNAVKDNAIQKRLNDFHNKVEEKLHTLESSLEEVGTNEAFTTAMLWATEIAIKTEQEKKREYLANAVYNSLKVGIDENIQVIFMDMISKYSVWHIQILEYFRDPKKKVTNKYDDSMGTPIMCLLEAYPELRPNASLVNKIISDLYADGLLSTANMNTVMTAQGKLSSRTTDLGNQFIDYLTIKTI